MSVSDIQLGSQSPFLLRLTREIYCLVGVPHLVSATSNLPHSSDYTSYATHTLNRWNLVSNLQPYSSLANALPTVQLLAETIPSNIWDNKHFLKLLESVPLLPENANFGHCRFHVNIHEHVTWGRHGICSVLHEITFWHPTLWYPQPMTQLAYYLRQS